VNHGSTLRTDAAALEARVARGVLQRLDAASAPAGVGERLRFARERALAAAARRERALAARVAQSVGGGAAALSGGSMWWLRLASLGPLLVLVAGLMFIGHLNREGQIQAAADVDAAILVDELPPAAYSDPGFAEFVRSARQ
jgi:hypothetical protein